MSRKKSRNEDVSELKEVIRELKKRDRRKTKEIQSLRKLVGKMSPPETLDDEGEEEVLVESPPPALSSETCTSCGGTDTQLGEAGLYDIISCNSCGYKRMRRKKTEEDQ